ncbi:MAG: amino-acid N-acetyltransferase [Rhodoluna sp.]
MPDKDFTLRPARTSDIVAIQAMRAPLVDSNVLLQHQLVSLYERVQEFVVAEAKDGRILAAGALHVMWGDLAEVRSLVVDQSARGMGLGKAVVEALVERAYTLGIRRVFCLTFEVDFFVRCGFDIISDVPVDEATFEQMVQSSDDGIAEFLDLARVKENTLGNTRMLRLL